MLETQPAIGPTFTSNPAIPIDSSRSHLYFGKGSILSGQNQKGNEGAHSTWYKHLQFSYAEGSTSPFLLSTGIKKVTALGWFGTKNQDLFLLMEESLKQLG